ncbi:hypothetical protein [Phocaeicola sp.]
MREIQRFTVGHAGTNVKNPVRNQDNTCRVSENRKKYDKTLYWKIKTAS